jgi:hypothetical protein
MSPSPYDQQAWGEADRLTFRIGRAKSPGRPTVWSPRPEPRRHGWYPSSRGRANASAPLPASARAARAMPSCDRTWWRWRAGCAASVRRAGSDHCAMLPRTWRNAATSTSRAGHSRQRRCDRCWCARTSGARTLFWEAYGKLRDELATRGDRGLRPAPGAATTAA